MKLDLFNAFKRGIVKPSGEGKERGAAKSPTTGPTKPETSQTDRTETTNSGDSRERPAFDFKRIPDVDDATVEAFFAATHEGSRRMPLLVAQWVYAELESALTTPGGLDALRMAELRGGMMALRRFAVAYQEGIEGWKRAKARRSEGEGD